MSAVPTVPRAVLAVEGIGVRYGRAPALEGVTLSVAAGSVYALLGRNGAGKSSLVRCALGQQRPDAGSVRLFGEDAWRGRREAMKRVGVLPEEPDAPPGMTAAELSELCRELYDRWDSAAVRARLERAGVPVGTPFGRLSKGQKGAVMLALCLGHGPELLVLDDPTLGLDAVARRALYDELIGDLADRGTTVLLTTHDLAGVEGLADRVGILDGAHLVVDEPLDGLKSRFRRIRCAPPNAGRAWSPLESVAETRREWGTEAIVSNFDEERLERFRGSAAIGDVEVQSLSLEEIFLALVGRREAKP
jgi:ABC-type multidrug transport system ATPase subunit